MQAVIALCHFCEDHGPRVLVTCQPMRNIPAVYPNPSPPAEKLELSPSSNHDRNRRIQRDSIVKEPDKEIPIFYGDCTRAVYDTEERCNACTSYGNGPCLLSNDHENKTTYISSQVALKEQVYDRVKNACIRSLSCEITKPAPETISNATQPMRIGGAASPETEVLDIENVKKKDGYLMFGDSDTGYCLSYAFRLQDAKARGFLRLFSLLIMTQDMASMTTNHDFFLEALRIMKDKLQGLTASHYQTEMKEMDAVARPDHASMSCRLPQQQLFIQRKIIIDTNRNLQTITGNDNIWCLLHKLMMWTLKTQTLRYMDQVMEGIPTQDMLVMMEMEHSDIAELDLDLPNQTELTHLQLANLKVIAMAFAQKEMKDLDILIRQVITGRQLIVESDHQILAKQFILAVTNLLPIGCLRINTCADQHYQSFQYNMLGTTVPLHVPSNEDVLIVRVSSASEEEPTGSLLGCDFSVIRRPEARSVYDRPLLLERYKKLLLDIGINIHCLEATLRSTRDQWIARAKLLYQLEKQRLRDPRMFRGDLMQLIRGCTEQDRHVLTFWQRGLSKAYKTHVMAVVDEYV